MITRLSGISFGDKKVPKGRNLSNYQDKMYCRELIQEVLDEFDKIEPEYFHINVVLGQSGPFNVGIFVRDFRDPDSNKTKTYYRLNTGEDSMMLWGYDEDLSGERKEVIERFNQNIAKKFGLKLIK